MCVITTDVDPVEWDFRKQLCIQARIRGLSTPSPDETRKRLAEKQSSADFRISLGLEAQFDSRPRLTIFQLERWRSWRRPQFGVEIRQRLLRHVDAQGERQLRRSHQTERQLNGLEMRMFGKLAGNDI